MTQDEIIRMAIQCQLINTSNRDGIYAQSLEAFAKLVAAKEREACAKVCEEHPDGLNMLGGAYVACTKAIRARGEA